MKTLNTINGTLNKIADVSINLASDKETNITDAINIILDKISDIKSHYAIKDRKSRKLAKDEIMSELKGETSKSILRAYNIAFTIINRDINVHTDLLTVSQIENLTKHGEVKAINASFNSEQYNSDVKDYIKSLKTRIMSVKTFEKISKK